MIDLTTDASSDIGLFEAIYSARSLRHFKPDPVPEALITRVIDAAIRASSGGNTQHWYFIVVRDAEKRRRLGEVYRECWAQVGALYRQNTPADDTQTNRILTSADHLGEHMGEAPVLILPASKGGDAGSVYPGVQNLFLAARALGLGTTLTTVHKLKEAEVREILGLPEDVQTWAMIPVGYPTGKWGEAKRRPVEEVTYWDDWRATRTR